MRRGVVLVAVVASLIGSAVASADTTGPVVRFATTLGNIDVQLLPQAAPQTVANFLAYVNSGAYSSTFFHRSVPGFVIQGGGYEVVNGNVQAIPPHPPIPNEFNLSNVRGTIAMALVSSSATSPPDPNSGTDEWFFNLKDNSASLDPQRFAVFGQVVDAASLSVMDAIASQPIVNAGGPFTQLPVVGYSGSGSVTGANLIMSPITVVGDTTTTTSTSATTSTTTSTSTSSSTPATTSTTTTTTVPSGPPPLSWPAIHGTITSTSRGVTIALSCAGAARCRGTGTVSAMTRTGRHRVHSLVGTFGYSLAPGRSAKAVLRLTRAGRALVRGRHHVWLTVRLTSSGGAHRTVLASLG